LQHNDRGIDRHMKKKQIITCCSPQIFQVHAMLSNKVPSTDYIGKSVNMFWNGVFHFFCLIVVIIGTILLWKLTRRKDVDLSGKLLAGGLLAGWGLFNIVEGIIDHHLLQLHNVIEFTANHSVGNYTFLTFSVVLLIVGFLIIKRHEQNRNLARDGDR
jgi:uncharacterized membrane protein